MHPIELADFLNGWGPEGLWDNTGFDAGFKEWELYLHWLVANRQNHVLWVLLWAEDWADFAESDERFRRLTRIVDAAHVYGLQVGVDVPIALHQQHSYQLLREQGELSDELAEIRTRSTRSWVLVLTFWPLSPAHQSSPIQSRPGCSLGWTRWLAISMKRTMVRKLG